jgi:hypothetical protein
MQYADLFKPKIYCAKMIIMVLRAGLDFAELVFDRGLLALVLAHLTEDGILLERLYIFALLEMGFVITGSPEARGGMGANLDVIFPREVSVWMRPRTIHEHGLPLSRRGRIVMPGGPLAILHLDSVKGWGCDGP